MSGEALPLTPADVTWLKERVPASIVDRMIEKGLYEINEAKAKLWRNPN